MARCYKPNVIPAKAPEDSSMTQVKNEDLEFLFSKSEGRITTIESTMEKNYDPPNMVNRTQFQNIRILTNQILKTSRHIWK